MSNALSNKNVDVAIFDLGWRMASIRYGIVTFIALSFSHIFSHQVPFIGEYQFPFKPFLIILGIGIIVCSGSWAVTLLYRGRIFSDETLTLNRVLKFIGINFITVAALYTLVQLIVFQPFSGPGFAIGLFVIGFLAIIENLSFLLVSITEKSTQQDPERLIINVGKRKLKVNFNEVAYFRLRDGIIYLHTTDGRKLATNLSSMDKLIDGLPKSRFFRANRQFIVKKESVTQLTKLENRKLQITINSSLPAEQIAVSRYKNKKLLEWFER